MMVSMSNKLSGRMPLVSNEISGVMAFVSNEISGLVALVSNEIPEQCFGVQRDFLYDGFNVQQVVR
jgi:hypothetical protein